MASEQARVAIRQFSDESKALANRVWKCTIVHSVVIPFHDYDYYSDCLQIFQMMNDSHIVLAKENIKGVWRELLQFIRNAKETAAEFTDPRILGEHLQIIFRDESK